MFFIEVSHVVSDGNETCTTIAWICAGQKHNMNERASVQY
jgi:hypothetical protein